MKRVSPSIRTIAALAVGSLTFGAATDAVAADGFTFGVGTHFAFSPARGYMPDTQRAHLSELKVDSFRDDVDEDAFGAAEPQFPLGRRLDRLNAMVMQKAYRPVLILRGRLQEKTPEPRYVPNNPREIAGFGNYAGRVTHATQALNPFYEIWNEWNLGWRPRRNAMSAFGAQKENPDFSPENYVQTAAAAYSAIKEANPQATVLTGAIGEDADWTWTRRALKAGLAKTGDGISVHFYNHCNAPPGRTAENMIGKVQEFRKVVTDETGQGAPPLYITEFGWPNDEGPCGIPRDLAAANLAQFTLWAGSTSWIKGVWAYELRDSGQNKTDREDNFGLYTFDDKPKPAACAYREAIDLARRLSNKHFRQSPAGIRWLEGKAADGGTVWAIWTTARDSSGTIQLAGAPAPMRPICGGGGEVATVAHDLGMIPLVIRANGQAADQVRLRVAGP